MLAVRDPAVERLDFFKAGAKNQMKVVSISNLDALKVLDKGTGATSYGCDQRWFGTERQRSSGCGPSVASSIMLYLKRYRNANGNELCCQSRCAEFMEEVWEYVTPKERGIHTTEMFCESLRSYVQSKGLTLEFYSCDIPEDKSARPVISEIVLFLETALLKDIPVAFLNLCNGCEENLDRWHWVTVISMEYEELKESVIIHFLDEGIIKTIDLALWHETTTLGGGFVYFSVR